MNVPDFFSTFMTPRGMGGRGVVHHRSLSRKKRGNIALYCDLVQLVQRRRTQDLKKGRFPRSLPPFFAPIWYIACRRPPPPAESYTIPYTCSHSKWNRRCRADCKTSKSQYEKNTSRGTNWLSSSLDR